MKLHYVKSYSPDLRAVLTWCGLVLKHDSSRFTYYPTTNTCKNCQRAYDKHINDVMDD